MIIEGLPIEGLPIEGLPIEGLPIEGLPSGTSESTLSEPEMSEQDRQQIHFTVTDAEAGHTLAKVLRSRLLGPSWSAVRRLIAARRVQVNETVCTDDARRLAAGDVVELLPQPRPLPPQAHPQRLVIRHLDHHIVVVEKPAGINTVRHPAEQGWSERRRRQSPTLEDLTRWAIARQYAPSTLRPHGQPQGTENLPRLRIVHRLDRDTSGLVVFARTVEAERHLGRQFQRHTVWRRYLAIIPGYLPPQTIRSRLVRDRGDGRRGSTTNPHLGKEAVTHIHVLERLPGYTLLDCRLETGRTHQIRIHLAEAGHPICGEKVYIHRLDGSVFEDTSGAPRLALHAAELGLVHPHTGIEMRWTMPLPPDLQRFLDRLRRGGPPDRRSKIASNCRLPRD